MTPQKSVLGDNRSQCLRQQQCSGVGPAAGKPEAQVDPALGSSRDGGLGALQQRAARAGGEAGGGTGLVDPSSESAKAGAGLGGCSCCWGVKLQMFQQDLFTTQNLQFTNKTLGSLGKIIEPADLLPELQKAAAGVAGSGGLPMAHRGLSGAQGAGEWLQKWCFEAWNMHEHWDI